MSERIEKVICSIDFGTSYSSIAIITNNGTIHLIQDPITQTYQFRSKVYIGPDGSFLVGGLAEIEEKSHPKYVIYDIKRMLGVMKW